MALSTFTELKTAIGDYLERDDLTSNIPDFITLAEARHKRKIRTRSMINRSAITVNARQVALPTGYLEGINLRLLTDPVEPLTEVNTHEMNRIRSEGTGQPSHYTIHTEIEFDVTPDSSYSGEIIFYKSFTALSDGAPSNDLLTDHPDVYLYGALIHSAPFLMHDERLPVWNALYESAERDANESSKKSRKMGPIVSRVVGRGP